jgi:hypothetical protein
MMTDIRSAWKLVQSRRSESREIRQTDVVQGSSVCEQEFFVRHLSQRKRRHSQSSKEWSESWSVIDCELLYSTVILIEASNKYNHQIWNQLLLVTQIPIRDNTYMCHIPNHFRDRVISLYSSLDLPFRRATRHVLT